MDVEHHDFEEEAVVVQYVCGAQSYLPRGTPLVEESPVMAVEHKKFLEEEAAVVQCVCEVQSS
jgi:hypothetical protein